MSDGLGSVTGPTRRPGVGRSLVGRAVIADVERFARQSITCIVEVRDGFVDASVRAQVSLESSSISEQVERESLGLIDCIVHESTFSLESRPAES